MSGHLQGRASGPSHTTGDKDINLVWLAQSKLRRRKFDECIEICSKLLERNPYDQVGSGAGTRVEARLSTAGARKSQGGCHCAPCRLFGTSSVAR